MALRELRSKLREGEFGADGKDVDDEQPAANQMAQILSVLPCAAESYVRQISLGLEGNVEAAAKARPLLRELFGGNISLSPGEDGSLWAEYGLHMTALLQAAGTCGRGDRI